MYCYSELPGPIWVAVSLQGAFIQHYTVHVGLVYNLTTSDVPIPIKRALHRPNSNMKNN